METGEAKVTGRNEWDITMELVNMAIHYDAIGSEADLKEKFKEYYEMVRGVQSEVNDKIRSGNMAKFFGDN